ncbi:hypothetical protein OHT59_22220 [Streptomyces sp. NBC_00243]|nr:hypothetical protein [Streptomyces sp. NBC_00243]WRZ21025.1 hypothetical protein OHT59_22220 [Streptomyces sp. NBC_00243]
MSIDVSGMVECRPWARILGGEDDEDTADGGGRGLPQDASD